ncbi:Urokinase plasminogen activator surface receptor [Labeo rohita]|uniref:Urokinase plasminogen activator surface receptor n=1 Tax=Labeo rohita TaxID=84645 RepID=A0ABQ8L053_LABRO|nr:Urokinase plasminogen activator surface receptor [Labeo rohita]
MSLCFIIKGHSLKCYQCWSSMGSCVDQNVTTCQSGFSECVSATNVYKVGETSYKMIFKNCAVDCLNGSVNAGTLKMSYSCCNTDLCNFHDAPDPSTITPNGKKCYYCNGQNCSNTVNCSGSEDHCFTGAGNQSLSIKGCASKSFCDYATALNSSVSGITCCEGNLCNDVNSVTQSVTQRLTQSITQIGTQNITQSSGQNNTQSGTQSVTQISTHSITQIGTQNITQSSGQNNTQSSTQSVTQISTHSITQIGTQNITQSSGQNIAQSNSAECINQSFLFPCFSLLSFILLH